MKLIDFRAKQEQRGVFHQRIGNAVTDLVDCDSYDGAFYSFYSMHNIFMTLTLSSTRLI